MNQVTESHSQIKSYKILDKYLILGIVFYIAGDIGTHAVNMMFTNLTEKNIFMISIASRPDWFIYALVIKIFIIGIIILVSYLVKDKTGYKVLVGYGVLVTVLNIIGFLIYGPIHLPIPRTVLQLQLQLQ